MEVITRKIVGHSYSEDSLKKVFVSNELKTKDSGTRERSPVYKELDKYDIGYSISNIGNQNDDYGFCFLDAQQATEGNYAYTIKLVILDTGLPESIIREFFSSVVDSLSRRKRNCLDDAFRVDRIIGKGNHPLSEVYRETTSKAIVKEVYDAYVESKSGSVSLSADQINRLKEIAQDMNTAF